MDEMRELLRQRNLTVSGLKKDLARRLAERTPSPTAEPADDKPTTSQLDFIRDLEKDIGEVAPASALTSKRAASTWISEAILKRDQKKKKKDK